MKVELILIVLVAMLASFSAYAEDAVQDDGYQQGLCTVAQGKI
jgi:hypothetical protein